MVVAGGGFAAVEAVLALNATLGPRADVILVSPRTTLDFRPAATIEPFADVAPLRYDLRAIAEDLGATFRETPSPPSPPKRALCGCGRSSGCVTTPSCWRSGPSPARALRAR